MPAIRGFHIGRLLGYHVEFVFLGYTPVCAAIYKGRKLIKRFEKGLPF